VTQDERLARLRLPALELVTDTQRRPRAETTGLAWLDDVVRDAVLGGVTIVQLREKGLATGDLIALGLHVRDAIARRALFFVNGDIEAAIALAADGIHLPADAPVTVRDVRRRAGERVLVSRAAHSLDEALAAEDEGADIVQLGTVFETASKPGARTIGVEGVREACDRLAVPVIAIGGITTANARAVFDAGAAGVAVIGAIMDAAHPREAARDLRAAVDRAWAA